MSKRKIIIITGATASGKSAIAMKRAQRHAQGINGINNGAIINADASQIYRDFPVLTAQPSVEDLAEDLSKVPHFLYGFAGASQNINLAGWLGQCKAAVEECFSRGLQPFVVGGTCMYIHAMFTGMAQIPAIPPGVFAEVDKLYTDIGHEAFLQKVLEKDADTPSDYQRLVRNFCLLEVTGKSLSWHHQHAEVEDFFVDFDLEMSVIDRSREEIYAACNKRFELMLQHGAVEEVLGSIRDNGEDFVPKNIIGYDEIRRMILGEIARDECTMIATQKTRNYAKRQLTWLRNKLGKFAISPAVFPDASLAGS